MKLKHQFIIGMAFVCLPTDDTNGATYTYDLYTTVERTDNITQSADLLIAGSDPESGNVTRGGINFAFETEREARWVVDIDGTLGRVHYSSDQLDSEDEKDVTANILFQPASSNFRFAILDSLQQISADRTSTQTVNNVRDVNVFSAAPSYFFNIFPASKLTTYYRYTDVSEDEMDASRVVHSAIIGFERQIGGDLAWSANVGRSNVEFDRDGREYDQESAFIRLSKDRSLTNFTVDLGQERLVDDNDVSELLVNVSVGRQINSYSSVNAQYSRGFSSPVNIDVSSVTQLIVNDQSAFVEGVLRQEQKALSYQYQRREYGIRLSIFDQSLEDVDGVVNIVATDEERRGVDLVFDYRFSTGQSDSIDYGLSVNYSYQKDEFYVLDTENEINQASIRLDYFFSNKLTFFTSLTSRDTSGTDIQSNTDSHGFLLGVEFSPRGRR